MVRRGKKPPEMDPKKAGRRSGVAKIAAVIRKAAPPEFTPRKNGKLGLKRGTTAEERGL